MTLYKILKTNKWIDLSAILTIDEPEFINHMGYGGWFVGFEIQFALREDTTYISRELDDREQYVNNGHWLIGIDGKKYKDGREVYAMDVEPVCVKNMREEQFTPLFNEWKKYKDMV